MRRTVTKLAMNKATFMALSNQMTEQLGVHRLLQGGCRVQEGLLIARVPLLMIVGSLGMQGQQTRSFGLMRLLSCCCCHCDLQQ